jgi:two-component system, NarL family, response regulator NreC
LSPELRLVLCDDHKIMRSGLRHVLAENPDIDVVSDVGTAGEAIDAVRRIRPDILILDLSLPDASGVSIIDQVHEASPGTGVLVLTMHDDVAYLRKAFAAGAQGYVLKAAADVELMQAVTEVAAGRRYVHPALGAALLADGPDVHEPGRERELPLSEREKEILRSVALGYTNPEMARTMGLSVRTVETYRHRLQQKLGLRSRAELARFAREAGLVN